jgi:putative endonuclease
MNAPLPSRRRRDAERRGKRGEGWAAWYLRLKGYRIVGRRVRTPLGEIDIIARRGRVTAFVEVKSRSSLDAAMAAVTPWQARHIRDACLWWIAGRDIVYCRFDFILVTPYQIPVHVENAFAAELEDRVR